LQFKDYARIHNSHYVGDKLVEHRAYFSKLFYEAPQKPKLKPRWSDNKSTIPTEEGGAFVFYLPQDLMEQIHQTATALHVSFFNYLVAAYCVFMNKMSDQNDFIIDTPMSTRNSEELYPIVGWMVGCLVSRVKVNPEETFEDLAIACRNSMMDAMDHVYYQDFKEHLEKEWSDHVTQLNILNDKVTGTGVVDDFTPKHYEAHSLYFDFSFNVRVYKNGISFICQYRFDAIGKADIEEFCIEFVRLLKMTVQSPKSTIKSFDKVSSGTLV
jgi:hypothetical protein